MKLIIQIPCYNEEATIAKTIHSLPQQIDGVDEIEYLIVDDGSSDNTIKVAEEAGADHIIRMHKHTGLAQVFAQGLEECLKRGANIIVNTDADNQYCSDDIPRLVQPIIADEADIVIGDRGVASHAEFSTTKRILQRLGSWVVAQTARLEIPDATSGFRAYSRNAALRTIVLSDYSYTLETLIQAGSNGLRVKYTSIHTNPSTRPSRLIRSVPQYVVTSTKTILRAYTMYKPLNVFSIFAAVFFLPGLLLGIRYLYFYSIGQGAGHIQSVILAAVLIIVGVQTFLIGLVADLVGFNRKILEDLLYRTKRIELNENNSAKNEK